VFEVHIEGVVSERHTLFKVDERGYHRRRTRDREIMLEDGKKGRRRREGQLAKEPKEQRVPQKHSGEAPEFKEQSKARSTIREIERDTKRGSNERIDLVALFDSGLPKQKRIRKIRIEFRKNKRSNDSRRGITRGRNSASDEVRLLL
jgi:hypothetical protein